MKRHFVLFFALLLLAACGEQQKAERIVKRFLDENLVNTQYKSRFGNLESTRRISQEQLLLMQQQTRNGDKLFKPATRYGAYKQWDELRYLKTTIIQDKDTAIRTVYLHPELRDDGVMAVKEN